MDFPTQDRSKDQPGVDKMQKIDTSSPKNKDEYVVTSDGELDAKLEINLRIISGVGMNLYVK